MNFILTLAFLSFTTGMFFLFEITPLDMVQDAFSGFEKKPTKLKDTLDTHANRKKQKYLTRELTEIKEILIATGRGHKFPQLTALSSLMFIVGGSVAIVLGNWFLAPVLATGFMFLPFWYIKLTQTQYKKQVANELETSLSIITTGYLRTENIVTAISESVEYLNPPIKNVFSSFLYQVNMVNPDIVLALNQMQGKINNPVFKEWVSSIILCQNDRSLKHTLTPTVHKLSDMRIVNGELETIIASPRQEFLTMVVLVLCNIPLLYMLNADWYNTLMHTIVGQIVMAICGTAIFISFAAVVKLTQPIEYKR